MLTVQHKRLLVRLHGLVIRRFLREDRYMGIQGLLPALKPITKLGSIAEFRGQRVAVDTYCWLHRAVYGSCVEMFKTVLTSYDPSTNSYAFDDGSSGGKGCDLVCRNLKWIQYILQYIDMLLAHNISVHLVFDGNNLPAKQKTEHERQASREECLKKGMQKLREGADHEARQFLSRAIDITPQMAALLIKFCRKNRPSVNVLVAPYEADAQLAYLSNRDIVDAVITEDSDVIPYGCKICIFKLEKDGGCQIVRTEEAYSQNIRGFDLRGFTKEMMVGMCIASGCDYLGSLTGFGLKKSHKLMSKYKNPTRMLRAMRFEGIVPITAQTIELPTGAKKLFQYEIEFHKAILTFQHQVVYCPLSKKLVNLTPLEKGSVPPDLLPYIDALSFGIDSDSKLQNYVREFLGDTSISDELGRGIAEGHLDPVTKNPFDLSNGEERQNCNETISSTQQISEEDAVEARNMNSTHNFPIDEGAQYVLFGSTGIATNCRKKKSVPSTNQSGNAKHPPVKNTITKFFTAPATTSSSRMPRSSTLANAPLSSIATTSKPAFNSSIFRSFSLPTASSSSLISNAAEQTLQSNVPKSIRPRLNYTGDADKTISASKKHAISSTEIQRASTVSPYFSSNFHIPTTTESILNKVQAAR